MNMNEIEEMDNNEEILQEMMDLTSKTMKHIQLKEHYRVIKELGSGSYGHVLLTEHRGRGRSMALKLMKKKSTKKDRFLMEYCVSLCLSSHPNIISTFAVAFETNKYFIFAQELATSGDLYSILEPGVGLPETIVKRCALQLSEALDFMHSKALVHRDIKLDNVLLFDKECHLIKLADFGLTRLEGFLVSPMSGHLPYSSPELCSLEDSDTLTLDSSLDVWAFGVLLFCISTGYFPWDTALCTDKQYEEFALWQNNREYMDAPLALKQFTRQALDMFQKLLTLNPDTRRPAIEVQKYLNVPWKIMSLKDNTNMLDNSKFLEDNVDNLNYHLQDTKMSTKNSSMASEESPSVNNDVSGGNWANNRPHLDELESEMNNMSLTDNKQLRLY
ncbi:serine/threonine-protein kinase SBK1-like [Bombina bombina]|uniref:serine/threonine-protein kinase SBK1-like n=1 Tax=Bombina bombina TaxID=8345 RepID=UPI00235AAC1F|nr:serine/threonine-protein kinase SBK1-like [Bombina bombina]